MVVFFVSVSVVAGVVDVVVVAVVVVKACKLSLSSSKNQY